MLLRVGKTVACVALLLPACTQDVDDPANFDPSQNMDSGGSADSAGDEGSTAGGAGMVSPGEQCDGANLQGFDCTSLGLGTGSLGCDPVTCTFDTSMCMGGGGGTSG